jgi:anti-sigma regulatory factor (Ser/Thr protein kinase)
MNARKRFSASPESVVESRRFVALALNDVPAATRQVVELLVSELATNAVTHAESEFEVSVDTTPESIRVAVIDEAADLPSPRSPSNSDPHGRGLHIVGELSDAWGVDVIEAQGKAIWFSVSTGNDLSSSAPGDHQAARTDGGSIRRDGADGRTGRGPARGSDRYEPTRGRTRPDDPRRCAAA